MKQQLKKLRSLFNRRDKLHYSGLLGLMVIGSLLDVVGVGAIPAFVAALAVPEQVMAYPVVGEMLMGLGLTTQRHLILWGCVGLIIVFLLKNTFLVLIYYAQLRTTEHYRVRLAHRLFTAYMRAPYVFHLERNSAELLRNVDAETRMIIQSVINPFLTLVMGVLMTTAILALLIVTTPGVALGGVVVMGVGSWLFLLLFRARLKYYGLSAQQERRASVQTINQGVGSLQVARVLGREGYFIDTFHSILKRLAKAERMRVFVSRISTPSLEVIAVTGLLLVVLFMTLSGTATDALIPLLALFGAAIVRLRATIGQVVNGLTAIRYGIVAVDPVYDDLKLLKASTSSSRESENTARITFEHAIEIEEVDYTYPNTETPALKNITLTIEKGSSVAFVGSTGSGKTTLVNVILGLLEPQKGRICVDGVDIHSNLGGWRAHVGYIPQTIYLLDDTIRRNVAYGLREEEIDEEKLLEALRSAQLMAFIDTLEEGLETVVGEQGMRLSGGQRQRIGLARALYHNPQVLLMDEATSSLDNRTEQLVMKALEEMRGERTFIMIAHRLSTVRTCDRLYFLREGRIEATGTYEELFEWNQAFRYMAEVV